MHSRPNSLWIGGCVGMILLKNKAKMGEKYVTADTQNLAVDLPRMNGSWELFLFQPQSGSRIKVVIGCHSSMTDTAWLG